MGELLSLFSYFRDLHAFVRGSTEDDFHVLVQGEAFQGASGRDPPALLHHLIHRLVRPLLVVVKEAEPGDAGVEGEAQGVRVDGMAPGPGQAVVLGTVFGVVDQEIRPFGKGAVILIGQAARMPVGEFVVGQKDEGFSLLFEPVSHPLVGVADRNGGDGQAADREGLLAGLLIADFRRDVVEIHGEIGRGHDAGDHLPDGGLGEGAAEHARCAFPAGRSGLKKGKPMM